MANSCNRCGRQLVTAWRTAKGCYFHPHCFTCAICDVVIESESQLQDCNLKEIYCKKCYAEYFAPIEEKENNASSTDGETSNTFFNTQQQTQPPPPPIKFYSECSINQVTNFEMHTQTSTPSTPVPLHGKLDINCNNKTNITDTNDAYPYSRNDTISSAGTEFNIETVLESTKPPAFTLQRSPSKIPKRMTTPPPPPSQNHHQNLGKSSSRSSLSQNNGLNKFLPQKASQNLIRAQSVNIPQQIQSKLNEYIVSKGTKFCTYFNNSSAQNKKSMPTVTPSLTNQGHYYQSQNHRTNNLPLKAVHFPIPESDAKKLNNRIGTGGGGVKSSSIVSSKQKNSSISNISGYSNRSSPSMTTRTPSKISHSSPTSTTQLKTGAEKKLSNFKMPSFTVPIPNKAGKSMSSSSPFFPSCPKKYNVHGNGTNKSQNLTHYLLPQQIMKGSTSTAKHQHQNQQNHSDYEDTGYKNVGLSTSASSAYFGNVTLPRPIQKGNNNMHQDNKKPSKKSKGVDDESVGGFGGLDCPICLDKLVNPSEASKENVVTCCGHIFHKECITNWLNSNGSGRCPTCSKACFKESMIPVYIEANIADNFKNVDNDELKSLLITLRSDYKQLKEKHTALVTTHSECETKFAITDSLRSAYEMESRTRAQLQWENKHLHKKLEEYKSMVTTIEHGDGL